MMLKMIWRGDMSNISIEEKIQVELKNIPKDKLHEIYDLIHYFRIGIRKEKIEDVKLLRLASEKKFAEIWKEENDDVCVCAITSNLEESDYGLTITTESMEEGQLKVASKVRADAITNIEQAIILKKIGKVKQVVFNKVLSKLNSLFVE